MARAHLLRIETPGEDGYEPPEMSIPLAILPAGSDPDAACRSLESLADALARHHGRRRAWMTRWHRANPQPQGGGSAHARADLEAWGAARTAAEAAAWEDALGRPPTLAERLLADAFEMRPRPLRVVAEPLPLLAPADLPGAPR